MKTTEENNRMIAEFMGGKFTTLNLDGFETEIVDLDNYYQIKMALTMSVKINSLLFHTSWDWLMPVIKTIREQICVDMCFDDFDDWRDNFKEIDPYNYSLEQCYQAVCQFIEWYNELHSHENN